MSKKQKTVELEIAEDEIITLKVVPDHNVQNNTQLLARAMHELYTAPRERIQVEFVNGIKITYTPKGRTFFDILLLPDSATFYVSVPRKWARFIELKIRSIWERAAVTHVHPSVLADFDPEKTAVCDVRYRKANFFACKTGRQDLDPLNSMLTALNDLDAGTNDRIRVSIALEPLDRVDWANTAAQEYKKYQKGEMPKRGAVNREDVIQYGFKGLETVVQWYIELRLLLIDSLLFFMRQDTGEERLRRAYEIKAEVEKEKLPERSVQEKNLDGGLAPATIRKLTAPTFCTHIRVLSQSDDSERRDINMRTVANSFKDLNADNEFHTVDLPQSVQRRRLKEVVGFKVNITFDATIMSDEEVGKLIQLPQAELQSNYEQIERIQTKEVEIPRALQQSGIRLGDVKFRERFYSFYQPTDSEDELCLPHVVIGGMGCGKTKGYGANFAVEAVENGFGTLVVDPAKGEMGDEIEAALPAEQVMRIRLGEYPISLDWNEVKYSPRARNRLANTILGFFSTGGDDAGMQTARFLRAAVMAMQTGQLSEILQIIEDKEYRKVLLCPKCGVGEQLNPIHIQTLTELNEMSDARRAQVLSPIYNRLNIILGDTYLLECMEARKGIDMVQLMCQRKAVVIDVPKSELGPEAVDLIVNLLSTKIDLAMTLRPEKEQFPYFVIFDEPHQFLRSAATWKSAAVESRKWRVGYVWMFHSWEQIPRHLAEIIKAAGPHYHLYKSSKKTYVDLAEEIYPYTVEDALKTPRFHAINIIQAEGVTQRPFMARMTAPPSMRKQKGEVA